jgi:hypothetical protein
MFLVPSHIRKTLQSVISEQSLQGPHTALVLLAHGQVLCAASNADTDWPSTSDDNDGEDELDDQEEENDDDEEEDEPYIPTPERNRMLRGIVKSQLIGIDGFYDQHEDPTDGTKPKLKGMKIECDVCTSHCLQALTVYTDNHPSIARSNLPPPNTPDLSYPLDSIEPTIPPSSSDK